MKKQYLLSIILLLLLFISCRKDEQWRNGSDEMVSGINQKPNNANGSENSGHIKIAVMSDLHFMHPSLLQNDAANGTAFKSILQSAPYYVLLEQSPAILKKVLSEVIFEDPDIVLISGDLTKDGERIGHETVAGLLNQLENNGIKVFIVPGNNDINNPTAYGYNGNSFYTVPNVSPAEFKSIHWNFGYGEAISSDPNSLSYIAVAAPGLWILSIDAVRYSPIYHRSGTIKQQTMQWIKQQMTLANQNGITVMGLMHHNLIEHFSGQSQITPNTIVEDLSASNPADNMNWQPVADSLMSWGLKVIFTGHSHVNDISKRVTGANTLYDVATGSLITPPSPYRIMVLKNKELDISTEHVTSLDAALPHYLSFIDYSSQVLSSSLDNFFKVYFARPQFGLVEPNIAYAAERGRNAYMAYISGDEKISDLEFLKVNYLQTLDPIPTSVIWMLNMMWTDIGVKDGKWHIKLINP
jgi:3',5'-cyclic AMP phosphodiesterase CpdA